MSVFCDRPQASPLSPARSQPEKKQKYRGEEEERDVTGESISVTLLEGKSKASYEYDDLREVCTLGTGSFGTVKLVHHELSGDVMALKILKKDTIVEFRQEKNILSEKKLLLECASCPFIVNLISTFNFPNKLCMLLELVQGGELLTHLYDRTDTIPKSSYGGFDYECIKFYLANILFAFDFMHSKGILYRDLKPENILVSSDGYIKLADFGFAKLIPYVTPENDTVTKTYTIVGSPEYMSPEMINGVGYDQSTDYWCLGCLIFELVFADSLFADREGHALLTQSNVTKASVESILQSFPEAYREEYSHVVDLAMSFLNPDVSRRAGYKDMGTIKDSKMFQSKYMCDVEARNIKPTYVPSIEHQLDTSNFFDYDEDDEEEMHHDDLDFEGDQSVFEGF